MRPIVLLTVSLIAGTATACVQTRSLRPEMTIQVKPTGSSSYVAQGRTNLPGQTDILVQAVRQLQPLHKSLDATGKPQPVYAIVARAQVKTSEDGKWKTTLKVLQPQGQGAPLESWQQNFLTKQLPMQADPNLRFIATTSPLPGNLQFEGDVAEGGNPTRPNPALQVNVDGSRYLRATQVIAAQAPEMPNKPTVEQVRRVVSVTVKPIPESADGGTPAAKSDAPLSPQAFVR
ncbi:hypothetical protein IQ266_15525 [filamentous cyanobacterium LEGE 11480]|uniref:Lipoprotein n=1 Tax=Romeriopsis navalis LEGE 11480 TaxID=2777977 RepID=A0A928Z3X7_9CYAN|nr:hypothetical protein [Romeriopsis navalis]MBE9031144.1 hypothetical protein [Romeriopsis navalis LEGE 11480]